MTFRAPLCIHVYIHIYRLNTSANRIRLDLEGQYNFVNSVGFRTVRIHWMYQYYGFGLIMTQWAETCRRIFNFLILITNICCVIDEINLLYYPLILNFSNRERREILLTVRLLYPCDRRPVPIIILLLLSLLSLLIFLIIISVITLIIAGSCLYNVTVNYLER